MFDFTRFNAASEEQFLCWYFAQAYKVSNTAVTIRERIIKPATETTKDQVKLVLDIRLGSSPTKGTENYTRIDIAKLFAGVNQIKIGAGGVPTIAEYEAFFKEQYKMPMDGLVISQIGNAYTITARNESLLFVGKKTLYIQ